MAGVTDAGFELKRLSDILADVSAALSLVVDPVTGNALQPDFSGADPAMQLVQVPLSQIADAWEKLQEAYNQFDPDKASESSLAALVQLNGLTRLDASPSSVPLTLSGTPGAIIPAGVLVTDVNSLYMWSTLSAVTLDGSGSGTVTAQCTTVGAVTVAPTQLAASVPGLASITAGAVVVGRDLETPQALRVRRSESTMAPAAGPVDALRANLANIEGVTYARVYQNNTQTTDARGIPGKSVAAVIVGGLDADIAAVLLERTGVTSGWYGSSSLTLHDSNGETYAPAWTRPAPTDIYLYVEIVITNAAAFPADGLAQLKNNVVAYAQGGAQALGITTGFDADGFPPGATVERSQLYTPLNFVPGHKVKTLYLGTSASPTGTADIPIAWDHYSHFTTANINIVVVSS